MFDVSHYKPDVIADPHHPKFPDQLRDAQDNLDDAHAASFFKTLLAHLRDDLPLPSKRTMRKSIYSVISVAAELPRFLTVFVSKCYAGGLPFSNSELVDRGGCQTSQVGSDVEGLGSLHRIVRFMSTELIIGEITETIE
jgi:hypothetical protein